MLWLIVAGLVAIAALIGMWTFRYWKATKPETDDAPSVEVAGALRRGGDDPTTVFQSR